MIIWNIHNYHLRFARTGFLWIFHLLSLTNKFILINSLEIAQKWVKC